MASAALGGYWAMLKSYHRVREPLYRQIIRDVLPVSQPGAAILDAGSGDAFYSCLLSEVLGPATQVVALDYERSQLRSSPLPGTVQPCQSDMERAGLRPHSFDAVWLCRSMHSAPDPCRRLAALARLLRPGGRLVVVENDFAHHPMLSWPVDFEQQVFNAHFLYLQSQFDEGLNERYHAARYLSAWLRQAGLQPTSVHTYVSEDAAPLSPEAMEYWQLFMEWLGRRTLPYLSPEDQARYLDLSNPQSPNYILASPDAYCVELTTVGCGTAPRVGQD